MGYPFPTTLIFYNNYLRSIDVHCPLWVRIKQRLFLEENPLRVEIIGTEHVKTDEQINPDSCRYNLELQHLIFILESARNAAKLRMKQKNVRIYGNITGIRQKMS
jgi:hypothetical protein